MRKKPHRDLFLALAFALLQQLLVAFSTWCLVLLAQAVARLEMVSVQHWGLLFLGALLLAYLPSVLARAFLTQAQIGKVQAYLWDFRTHFQGQLVFLNQKKVREAREPYITHEAWITLGDHEAFILDFFHLVFGVSLNLVVLASAVDAGFLGVMALGIVFNLLLLLVLPSRVSQRTHEYQESRNGLFARLAGLWDHTVVNNQYNNSIYEARLEQDLEDCRKTSRRAMLWQEAAMALPMILGLILLAGYFLISVIHLEVVVIAAFVATFQRQVQLLQYLSELTGYLILFPSWRRRLAQLESKIVWKGEIPDPPIDWKGLRLFHQGLPQDFGSAEEFLAVLGTGGPGRWRISGINGSGKTTLAGKLKTQLGDQAFYLPASSKLMFQVSRETLSTGEALRAILLEIHEKVQVSCLILDEWDANLDPDARFRLDAVLDDLSLRFCLVEVTHRA